MDLAFTPDEQQFRQDIRAWVRANLPADTAHKVHNALRLSRDDLQGWAKILGKKRWLGHAWPQQFGGPGWNAVDVYKRQGCHRHDHARDLGANFHAARRRQTGLKRGKPAGWRQGACETHHHQRGAWFY